MDGAGVVAKFCELSCFVRGESVEPLGFGWVGRGIELAAEGGVNRIKSSVSLLGVVGLGGTKRRRSSVSLREVVGLEEGGGKKKGSRVHPEAPTSNVAIDKTTTTK